MLVNFCFSFVHLFGKHWLKPPTLARKDSSLLHKDSQQQEVLGGNVELASCYQLEEFRNGAKETPRVLPPNLPEPSLLESE